MKPTDFVDNLQQTGKINNLQQVCGVSGCVDEIGRGASRMKLLNYILTTRCRLE